ncbi:phosphoribosylformylglycinamidine synthase [Trichuris trichiura]|uniref:phosphoribosylformylglycinamidine synthase n=1 Tax=Trichuris trichiura TaxID=36087 RepID=A0A077ZBI6_TRITR|nr:phosphoribosylformylglycinamidine synthase [Trichuris trichiura]
MAVYRIFSWPAEVSLRGKFACEGTQQTESLLEPRFEAEYCFYLFLDGQTCLNDELELKLLWLFRHSFPQAKLSKKSRFEDVGTSHFLFEVGPRPSFVTPFSSNAVSIFRFSGLHCVVRLEKSVRYRLIAEDDQSAAEMKNEIIRQLHDRMTECEYTTTCNFFAQPKREGYYNIDVIGGGRTALEEFSRTHGLSLDDNDIMNIAYVFRHIEKRNPTNVELFDLAQSNSEHCRHWFFKGSLEVDGVAESQSLFAMVVKTQENSNLNNVIKFCDNSSAIRGFQIDALRPGNGARSSFFRNENVLTHILLTAETHNFPTGVCPFPGAATGVGGRIRDVHATGRGAYPIAAAAGYSFGNLHIPGYALKWEQEKHNNCCSFASPLNVIIEASNGASDYGNKFGEPVICGFARSFDQRVQQLGERFGYVKPIMFTAGLGSIDGANVRKNSPVNDMFVIKLGGPVFRVGMGGGSASSSMVQGELDKASKGLEYDAVQRGDPEMEQKLNRVIRACAELRRENPISSIHDQGAGGNGNVIKELVEPLGAELYAERFTLGDSQVSVCELWAAEYQESDALLVGSDKVETVLQIAKRERCYCDIVGKVTNNGKITLHDFASEGTTIPPVNLRLASIRHLSSQQKKFNLKSINIAYPLKAYNAEEFPSLEDALSMVLRLPSVCSKRYLTNKVDRSVSGLVAMQQCVGPFHTPVADVAVVALSFLDNVGAAMAIGEQPVKMLLNPESGARMTVAESLTNLVFAPISDLKDVKCSANWMWPAKFPGEDFKLLTACRAMCQIMSSLGIAVDGGKDSLSMAANVSGEIVKAPGTLVVTSYVQCTDITRIITPALKRVQATLIYVRFGSSLEKNRLGGSALAQCLGNLFYEPADLEKPHQFCRAFRITQQLISDEFCAVYAGHDVSDGGLIVCLLEMAFAGNCNMHVVLPLSFASGFHEVLFAEEAGIVLQVPSFKVQDVLKKYHDSNVPSEVVGYTSVNSCSEAKIEIFYHDKLVLEGCVDRWRQQWEETSYRIERMQCNVACADEESSLHTSYKSSPILDRNIKVAIIREEGTNGDREMAAALYLVGFEVWDVTMQDLLDTDFDFDPFRGIVFPGGFSYGDVLGASKGITIFKKNSLFLPVLPVGWAATIMFNEKAKECLKKFISRPDTFILGVCNGCQLMATLGIIGAYGTDQEGALTFTFAANNKSHFIFQLEHGRWKSFWTATRPAVLNHDFRLFVSNQVLRSFSDTWKALCWALGSPMAKVLKAQENGPLNINTLGRFNFSNDEALDVLEHHHLIPIRYVGERNEPTVRYPFNPNGSPHGIAGICSPDGRCLALMPHPERCFMLWQWPYCSEMPKETCLVSPWLLFFRNAYCWCMESSNDCSDERLLQSKTEWPHVSADTAAKNGAA